MAETDWQRLQTLFAKAVALGESDREAFLQEECRGDVGLRQQVDALLHSDVAETGALSGLQELRDSMASDSSLAGGLIDTWRLVRRIGVGGMGSVFLAERADGSFEQTVALKVVKKGMDTENVIRRFQMERQILARLDHPNIARVIDGGVTADGRPYFVMEYVDGVPINEYCDRERLGVRQRLGIFRSVCQAVHYAHQSLVVHRDIKPSNVLVTADGNVKLLDFGIAKLLGDSEDQELTRTGMQLLTPTYAAPEQLLNGAITTQTDVYALGVILYELLCGRRPFEVSRTTEEYREQVLAGSPARPSTAITREPLASHDGKGYPSGAQLSESRGLRVDRLKKRLQGDLDTICLMALRRDPKSRYQSANQLADDVRSHLNGMPVVARPDSVAYRIGKFVQRHQVGVVTTCAVVIGFVALTGFYTAQLAEERDIALDEQQKTNEVVRFVTGLFEVSDPSESRGEEVSARALLDAGALRIQSELNERPGVQATLMRVLGEVYYSLGSYEQAKELIGDALVRQQEMYGDDHPEVATAKLALGLVHHYQGDRERAGLLIREARVTRETLLGYEHRDTMEAISSLAFLEETNGEYEIAEALHLETLALARHLYDGDDENIALAMTKLAGLYRIVGRHEEAEPLLRDALAMQDRIFGGEHPDSADTRRQLAGLLRDTRRFEESERLYKEVIDSRVRMLGPDHIEVAHTWNSYSQLLAAMGQLDAAVAASWKFIEIMKRVHNGPHPSFGAAYNNLAILFRDQEDLENALKYYQLSIDMQDAVGLPPRHPNRSFPASGIGEVYLLQGRMVEAEAIFRDILELRRENFPEDHRVISEVKSNLGAALSSLQQYAEAEGLLIDAYGRFLDTRGSDAPRTRKAAGRLANLFEQTGDEERAAEFRALAGAELP